MAMRTRQPLPWRATAIVWLTAATATTSALAQAPSAPPMSSATPPAADDPLVALTAKRPEAPPNVGRSVRIERPDGTPATDAVVVCTPWSGLEARYDSERLAEAAWPGDQLRQQAMRARDGVRLHVDGLGTVRAPFDSFVFAFTAAAAAEMFVHGNERGPSVLSLQPVHECTVEVVDAAGVRVDGVPIAVHAPHENGSWPIHLASSHQERPLRTLTRAAPGTVVALAIGSRRPIEAPLPPHRGRVRLQLPPTTTFSARLAGDLAPGTSLQWQLSSGNAGRLAFGTTDEAGTAHWPFVEIGAEVEVVAQLQLALWSRRPDFAAGRTTATANAPTLACERLVTAPIVAVALRTPAGTPARHRAIHAQIDHPHDRQQSILRTNRDGWLELPLSPQVADGRPVRLQLQLLDVVHESAPEATARFEVRFDAARRIDHGSIRCTALPPGVDGHVVTPAGEPVVGLEVAYGNRRQRTDAAGHFTFPVAPMAGEEFALGIEPGWCFVGDDPWHCTLRTRPTGLRLVAVRAASLRVHSDLDELDLSPIRYRLESASDDQLHVDLPFDWRNERLPAPPGHWHFVAHVDGRELLRLRDVHGESGIETHDARFLPFDWRAFARLVTVTVLDGDGRPAHGCSVSTGRSSVQAYRGRARLLLPRDGHDVVVEAPDGTVRRLLGVTDDQVVVLGNGTPLTVQLSPPPKLPGGVALELACDEQKLASFDANGVATVVLPKAGSYQPTLRVHGARSTFVCTGLNLAALDVPAAGRKFVLELTAEQQRTLANGIERVMAR